MTSYFGWDSSAARLRPARAMLSFERELAPGPGARRCIRERVPQLHEKVRSDGIRVDAGAAKRTDWLSVDEAGQS